MVLLTITPAVKSAIDEFLRLVQDSTTETPEVQTETKTIELEEAITSGAIEHRDLIDISNYLVKQQRGKHVSEQDLKPWRLDTLLKGATVYQPPPPPKPEPTPEYKALMQRLREQEAQRQYERMTNPMVPGEIFKQRRPHAASSFDPATSHGQGVTDEVDEVTYADVNRQMILIINVLVSIVACGVAIWIGARHWSVPQRLGLSMLGSCVVAVAEVAIYLGYIRRIREAKDKERKSVEHKEITETWVIDKNMLSGPQSPNDRNIRFRKGRHR